MNPLSRKDLDQLFIPCDPGGPDFVDQVQHASFCGETSGDDLSDVFGHFDTNYQGRIDAEGFVNGHRETENCNEQRKILLIRQSLAAKSQDNLTHEVDETITEEYSSGLEEDLRAFSCHEEVCELYQNLHSLDNPELLTQFENVLLSFISDLQQHRLENEKLEISYKREKEEHDKHLRRLEEELEQQVLSVEDRVRRQEKEHLEYEKLELQNQLQVEISMLQQSLWKLQQDGENMLDKSQEEHLVSLKKRLEEILTENRMLKLEVTDAQTSLAVIRSQMASIKHQLEEKKYELEIGNKTISEYSSEQEKLQRQLQQLHEANKTLVDTNDNLKELLGSVSRESLIYRRTSSIDSGHSAKNEQSLTPIYSRKNSIVSDFADIHQREYVHFNKSLVSGMLPKFLTENDDDNFLEDLDSGHSTLRDINDVSDDTETESGSFQKHTRRGTHHKKLCPSLHTGVKDKLNSHDETDTERSESPEPGRCRFLTDHKCSSSSKERSFNQSLHTLNKDESVFVQRRGSTNRQLPEVPNKDVILSTEASKEPERMYKIVLAGDAAVGKSSFILRLCQGKFLSSLSSTLGVDFHTKVLDIDGHPTALQLWDTAGQERFRSVARTYFRRADGVLLLYDVTYERSFLNLREWLNAIEEVSQKIIPVMLVGNKTDARPEREEQKKRVVKYAAGAQLSREINALFIETSAKDGSNISEAVIELTRLLRTNEDMELKTAGMQLHEIRNRKSSSCCKRY